MRWSRIKNIIILLLVTVNIFLLGLVGLRAWRTQRGERETRERMLQVLANNGIEFTPGEVPGALELLPRQVTAEAPGAVQAAGLVGELTDTRQLGTRTTYTGARGEVTFSASGEVEAELLPGAWEAGEGQYAARAAELLNALGVQTVRVTGEREEAEGVSITVTQLWEGVPAFDRTLTLTWAGGSFTHLSGRYLMGTEEPGAGSGELITASTALTRFLKALNDGGYVCSRITGMYAGYLTSGTGTVSLTPAWFVETDAWPWRFAVDGYTGSVTAAE